jgi:hypothetical protein
VRSQADEPGIEAITDLTASQIHCGDEEFTHEDWRTTSLTG